MLIQFNEAKDFVKDLKKETLAKPVVRLAYLRTAHSKILPLTSLFILATAKTADGDLIRLDHYCGTLWGVGQEDEQIKLRAESIFHYIEANCNGLQLEVRGGFWEEDSGGKS